MRQILQYQYFGPAFARVAADRVLVVMGELGNAKQFGHVNQHLKACLTHVAVVFGQFVASGVIGQRCQGRDQADNGELIATYLLQHEHTAGSIGTRAGCCCPDPTRTQLFLRLADGL